MKNSTCTLTNKTTAKIYLSQIKIMLGKIDFMQKKIESLKAMSNDTSAFINPIKVLSSKDDNSNAIMIENIIDLENQLEFAIRDYYMLLNEIESKIATIQNDNCKMILFFRYINNYTFDEIIYALKLSRATVYRLHAKGVQLIEDMI